MFSETLLDHARYPHNGGAMPSPDAVGRTDRDGQPPITKIYLRASGGKISATSFETFGCGVSVAACSMLTDMAQGKSFQECLAITSDQVVSALEGVPDDRRFCADLAVQALHRAVLLLVGKL